MQIAETYREQTTTSCAPREACQQPSKTQVFLVSPATPGNRKPSQTHLAVTPSNICTPSRTIVITTPDSNGSTTQRRIHKGVHINKPMTPTGTPTTPHTPAGRIRIHTPQTPLTPVSTTLPASRFNMSPEAWKMKVNRWTQIKDQNKISDSAYHRMTKLEPTMPK